MTPCLDRSVRFFLRRGREGVHVPLFFQILLSHFASDAFSTVLDWLLWMSCFLFSLNCWLAVLGAWPLCVHESDCTRSCTHPKKHVERIPLTTKTNVSVLSLLFHLRSEFAARASHYAPFCVESQRRCVVVSRRSCEFADINTNGYSVTKHMYTTPGQDVKLNLGITPS